jgi:hypothetical protein
MRPETFWTHWMRGFSGLVRMMCMAMDDFGSIPAGPAADIREHLKILTDALDSKTEKQG